MIVTLLWDSTYCSSVKLSLPSLLCLLALLSFQTIASAQITIIAQDTQNTGQDIVNGGMLAPGTQTDSNWQFVGYDNSYQFGDISYAPAGTAAVNGVPSPTTSTGISGVVQVGPAYVVENPPTPWAPPTANAEYISANPDQLKGGQPGIYIYQFSFTSPVSGVVTLSGTASADNGLAIVYNGTLDGTFGGQLVASTNPSWTSSTNADTPAGGSVLCQRRSSLQFLCAHYRGRQYGRFSRE